jgi:hypothetical protein
VLLEAPRSIGFWRNAVNDAVGLNEGRKSFFFEKKKQETFDYFGCGPAG